MAFKISRAIWFISILGVLATLLFVYAGLPEDMILFQEGADFVYGSREGFFYGALILVALINSMVFLVGALYHQDAGFRTWFNGLITVLNLFFVISLLLIGTINSNEKFAFERIGFAVYGSVTLIALWALAWPVIVLIRKFSGKAAV